MKKILHELAGKEKGQALIVVLGFMVLGGLTITSLLAYVITGLNADQLYKEKMVLSYTADAGVEEALWRIRNEGVPLELYDYETEFTYSLPQDINDKAITTSIKQIWPLFDLESDENGTSPPSCFTITGGVINKETGEYKVQISYNGAQGDLLIDRVGAWLPSGFEYITSSSCGITTDDPTEVDWHGGKALLWGFQPAANFTDLPLSEPPGGGFTPGTEYPATRFLTFNVSPAGELANSSYSWARTTNNDVYLAWETGYTIYQVISTATDNATGESFTVESYTYSSKESALDDGGSQVQGDYRAIGNTMMEDTDSDWRRETFVDESSATIANIPEDAEVTLAYLYWSGWREWGGDMEADRYVGLKIDGNSVYFNEEGDAVLGELPCDPATEILRPNAKGSSNRCKRFGDGENYRCVDEVVADEDSTYVYPKNDNTEMDTYNIDNLGESNGTINSVTVFARARAYDLGACDDMRMQIVIRTDSTDDFGSTITLVGNAGWDSYLETWLTNPNTGEAWTWGEIKDLQIGIKLYDDGTGSPQCTQVYAEVNYTPISQGVEASKWWLLENNSPNYAYSCFRDVTELVKLISLDGNATYTVASVAGDTENEWSYAGWSLVIIYSSPSEEAHQLFLYDTFLYADNDSSHTFTIEGFEAPLDAEATLTCFVGEGDDHYDNDYMQFNSYYLFDGINPQNNVWNGKSSGLSGEPIDGVDIDTFDVSSPIINSGDTSAEVTLTTEIDSWNLVYIILAFRSELGGLMPNSVGIISYNYTGGS